MAISSTYKPFELDFGQGEVFSLHYVKGEKGPILDAQELRKLPQNKLYSLISAAGALFAQKDVSARLSSIVSKLDVQIGEESVYSRKVKESYIQAVKEADLYAKRCGIGPYKLNKEALSSYEQHIADRILEIAKSIVLAPNDPYEESLSNYQAGVNFGCDTVSVARNIMRSIESIGPDHPHVAFLGNWVLGLLGIAAGFALRSAKNDYTASLEINDNEGVRDCIRRLVENSLTLLGSVAWGASNIVNSIDATLPVGMALDALISVAFISASTIGLGISVYNIYRCFDFRNTIDSYAENSHLSKKEQVIGALQFFRDQIWLSDEEVTQIRASVLESSQGKTSTEIEKVIIKKIEDKAKEKISCFKRRAGNKSVKEIIKNISRILKKLEDPSLEKEGIEEGIKLIQLVKRENLKKIVFYSLMMIAFIIGLISSVMMILGTFGAIPFILGAISGAIWVSLTVWGAFSYFKGRWRLGDFSSPNAGLAFTSNL